MKTDLMVTMKTRATVKSATHLVYLRCIMGTSATSVHRSGLSEDVASASCIPVLSAEQFWFLLTLTH